MRARCEIDRAIAWTKIATPTVLAAAQLMFALSATYLALAPDLLVRESARPLSRKSILFATPRSEGASDLSAALVDAGARPLWCPALEHSPLDDATLGPLDEAVMRLAEYDVLCVVSRTADVLSHPEAPLEDCARHFCLWQQLVSGGSGSGSTSSRLHAAAGVERKR